MRSLLFLFTLLLGLGLIVPSSFAVENLVETTSWSFLRPVSDNARTFRSEDFLKMLELSSENPRYRQRMEMKTTTEPRYSRYRSRRSRSLQKRESSESLDLSLIEREGVTDIERERIKQNRARQKALRFRQIMGR